MLGLGQRVLPTPGPGLGPAGADHPQPVVLQPQDRGQIIRNDRRQGIQGRRQERLALGQPAGNQRQLFQGLSQIQGGVRHGRPPVEAI
jgi:hypothetical protein